MKKKLLALAVAGAFVAPAAMADTANVNIYGVMNMSYDSTSTGSSAGGSSYSQTKISSNTSRIGFKGSEDLGGGMNAFFQLESLLTPDTAGGTTAGGRNSFVGIGGESWGSVLLGNTDSPYKSATRGMDLFGDTIADNRSLMGGVATVSSQASFEGRNTNVIQYDSPNISGFKASFQYVAGAETATTAATSATKGTQYGLSGTYTQGPMNLAVAYETHDFGSAGSGTLGAAGLAGVNQKEKAYKLAGSYTMDQITGILIYEKTSDDFVTANKRDHRAWYLAGKFAVTGSDAVKLAYTNVNNLNSVANTGAKQISLGYDHSMSKRTTVYALYTKLTNDSAAAYNLGIGVANSTGQVTAPGNDADPSAFSIGIKHVF